MRALLPPLLLLADFGAPHGGCDCGHMGSGAHAVSIGHASLPSAHFPVSSISATAGANAPARGAPAVQPHFGHAVATGIRRALVAGARTVEALFGIDPDAPDASDPAAAWRTCQTAEDCGDDQLGRGTVCDHWSEEPRSLGICREACRNDDDCPPALECRSGLDPDGPSWGGCIQ